MGTGRHILVVDGDPGGREEIQNALHGRGMQCEGVGTAAAAVEAVTRRTPDLIILELYLPDLSGLGLCRLLRENPAVGSVPLMVVSGQASEIDRVLAFEAGADDFLAKPFYAPELGARVAAILRGVARAENRDTVGSSPGAPVDVDLERGRAAVLGEPVDLTRTELQILGVLVGRAGKVVRRRELIERLWGVGADLSERAIDAHVKSIRRKLGSSRALLETVRGVGYRLGE